MSKVAYYLEGQDRNEPYALSHTYALTEAGNYWPMCGYGWNRSNGTRLSIFRNPPGSEGDCKLCRRNVAEGKRPHWKHFPPQDEMAMTPLTTRKTEREVREMITRLRLYLWFWR